MTKKQTPASEMSLDEQISTLLSAPLQIQAQYIKDLSFENPHFIKIMNEGMTNDPKLNVNIEVQAQGIGNDHYEVILNTQVRAISRSTSDKDEKTDSSKDDKSSPEVDSHLFLVELSYGGVFSIPTVPPEVLKPLLLIECPRLLFPFVRSVIAEVTKESGLPPVLLAPVNFIDLYKQSNAATSASH